MADDNIKLRMFLANLKRAENKLKRDLKKDAMHDAKILKQEIENSFDENASHIPLHGYYLHGKGHVGDEGTTVEEGVYYKPWQKPKVTITPIGDGVYVTASGKDVIPLEYGSGTDGMEPDYSTNDWWVMNSEEGSYKALNGNGGGNWYRAIEIAEGNEDPLLSTGEPGTRFFAKGNAPSQFMTKAIETFNNAIGSDRADLKLTRKGIAGLISNTLKGGK